MFGVKCQSAMARKVSIAFGLWDNVQVGNRIEEGGLGKDDGEGQASYLSSFEIEATNENLSLR
jgi:hypothetical protein